MAESATAADQRSAEIKSSARTSNGRFAKHHTGNPGGRPKLSAERRALRDLCADEREPNMLVLTRIRDTAKDVWARLEAVKVMAMYSDGRPSTHSGAQVAVAFNLGGDVSGMSASQLYATQVAHPELDQGQLVEFIRRAGAPKAIPAPRPVIEAVEAPQSKSAVLTSPEPKRDARIDPLPDAMVETFAKLGST